jgi:hypothetical protein
MNTAPSTPPPLPEKTDRRLERAQKILKWLAIAYYIATVVFIGVTAAIARGPQVNPHNNPIGLLLIVTIPGAVIAMILALIVGASRHLLRRGTAGGLKTAFAINATIAFVSLCTAQWIITVFHGWAALLIWQASHPEDFPETTGTLATAESAQNLGRPPAGIRRRAAIMGATVFAITAVGVLVLCAEVGWDKGPLLLAPILLGAGWAFYHFLVKRCPQCKRALRDCSEPQADTANPRVFYECTNCKISWNAANSEIRSHEAQS